MGKLDIAGLRRQAENIENDKGAQALVGKAPLGKVDKATPAAETTPKADPTSTKEAPASKEDSRTDDTLLVVTGRLSDRNNRCGKPKTLYFENELLEWVKNHTRGPDQVVFNQLIREGIKAIEKQAKRKGMVFVDYK